MPFPPLDPTKFPPAAKRDSLSIILVSGSLLLSLVLMLVGVLSWGLPPYLIPFIPFVLFVPIMVFVMRRLIRVSRRVHAAAGRLCVYCGYDVSRLTPKGTCPECGGPYDHTLCRAMWSNVGDLPPISPPQKPSSTPR